MATNLDNSELGRRIRAERERRDWNQVELATRSGLSQPTVSQIERGGDFKYRSIRKIAEAFGVDVGWFYRRDTAA